MAEKRPAGLRNLCAVCNRSCRQKYCSSCREGAYRSNRREWNASRQEAGREAVKRHRERRAAEYTRSSRRKRTAFLQLVDTWRGTSMSPEEFVTILQPAGIVRTCREVAGEQLPRGYVGLMLGQMDELTLRVDRAAYVYDTAREHEGTVQVGRRTRAGLTWHTVREPDGPVWLVPESPRELLALV